MKRIIAFTGLPRSGKDTAASELYWHGYHPASFAAPLKEAAAVLLNRPLAQMEGKDGFDREATMPEWGFSVRWFLQRFGTECLRQQIMDDFWIRRMEMTLEGLEMVVVTDCRFLNEIEMVRKLGGKIVRIERNGCVDNGHVSNKPMPYDILITNNGSLEQFKEKIACLAATIWNTKKPTKSSPRSSKSAKSATRHATSSKKQAKSTRATGSTSTTGSRSPKAAATTGRTGGSAAGTRTGRKAI